MTWVIPNKHGRIWNILMSVHKVQGEEFHDFSRKFNPPAAVMPAEGLNDSRRLSDSDKKILTLLKRG
jgi:hypothetical protein